MKRHAIILLSIIFTCSGILHAADAAQMQGLMQAIQQAMGGKTGVEYLQERRLDLALRRSLAQRRVRFIDPNEQDDATPRRPLPTPPSRPATPTDAVLSAASDDESDTNDVQNLNDDDGYASDNSTLSPRELTDAQRAEQQCIEREWRSPSLDDPHHLLVFMAEQTECIGHTPLRADCEKYFAQACNKLIRQHRALSSIYGNGTASWDHLTSSSDILELLSQLRECATDNNLAVDMTDADTAIQAHVATHRRTMLAAFKAMHKTYVSPDDSEQNKVARIAHLKTNDARGFENAHGIEKTTLSLQKLVEECGLQHHDDVALREAQDVVTTVMEFLAARRRKQARIDASEAKLHLDTLLALQQRASQRAEKQTEENDQLQDAIQAALAQLDAYIKEHSQREQKAMESLGSGAGLADAAKDTRS